MVLADPIKIEQPVAMADVAMPGGSARTGAGGPVETEIRMTTATDRTGASGSRSSKTDAPVTPEFCFQSGNNRMTVSGLAETGTGGPVGDEKGRSLTNGIAKVDMRTGTGTGGPVIAGARFTTVAEVYAPISGTKIQQGSDVGELDPIEQVTVEMKRFRRARRSECNEEFRVMWGSDGERRSREGVLRPRSGRDPADVRHGTDTDTFGMFIGS